VNEPVVELRGNDVVLLAVVLRTALRTTRFLTPGARATLTKLDETLGRAVAQAPTGDVTPVSTPVSELTVTEAATAMGCSTRYVRKLISLERLPGARRMSAGWLLPAGEIPASCG
jgi:excisionase family DNA binding protein